MELLEMSLMALYLESQSLLRTFLDSFLDGPSLLSSEDMLLATSTELPTLS